MAAGEPKSGGLAVPQSSDVTPLPPVGAIDDEATTINTVNAGVFVAQALSGLIWLPISTILGRRSTYLVANIVLCLCSIGCAVAPNLAGFSALWILGGTTGPFFLVAGQTILADIFEPTVRGAAVGIFLGCCVSANTIAPLIGSIIATFTSWRVIYGVEAGMSVFGLVLAFFFIPSSREVGNPKTAEATVPKTRRAIIQAFNPMHVFRQFAYPRVLLANLTCGLLGFNQYGILSSVRVINPRFNLDSPLQSGLFYLAPGAGFLIGSIIGGKVSDITVKRYIRKRNGQRLPEDRLNSSLPWILIVLPLGTLLYGWSVKKEIGGLALPIISAFVQGVGLMASFSGLNTYAAGRNYPYAQRNEANSVTESRPVHRTAVITGKYVVQYSFGAGSVGGVVPMIDAIGVGWAFTATALAAVTGGVLVLLIARYSKSWKH
ncbi:MFS transporter [Fusarium albosuccineum]|uniref:MFS transporter n=1 Tax=Fusarium albosuccineum TaxID=1237068 RepID=A0A8H4LQX1_9HYPO|nr:MFS transporter [Fusarium albosuccineum]